MSKSFEMLEKISFRTWVPVLESLSGNVDHKMRTLDYNEYANKNEDNDEGKINESASKAWGIRLFSRHGGEKTGFCGRQIRRKEAKVVSGSWVLDSEPLPLLGLEGACGRQKILEASAGSLRRVTAICYWACCDMLRAVCCHQWADQGVIRPWLECDRPQVLVEKQQMCVCHDWISTNWPVWDLHQFYRRVCRGCMRADRASCQTEATRDQTLKIAPIKKFRTEVRWLKSFEVQLK